MDDDILNTPFWLVRFYMDGLGFLKPTVRSVKERVEQVLGKVSKTFYGNKQTNNMMTRFSMCTKSQIEDKIINIPNGKA